MSQQQLKFIPEKPVTIEKLDEWLKAELNVLLVGEYGVGKTSKILEVFNSNFGTKWAFFNGATTDPWTDLIGIPSVDESSGEKVIKYVKPEELGDDVCGIYIDELNRAKVPTRNALLELIQFKSINGRKFPNLTVVWASINPPRSGDEDPNAVLYDVEELDPAQVDRFHIIVKIPNEPDASYFTNKYGLQGTNLVEWWKQQAEETRRIISPRRLEYIAMLYRKDIDISDALPINANIKLLKKMIDSAPVINRVNDLFEKRVKAKQDQHTKINEEISALLNNENNFEELKEFIVKNSEWRFLKWLKSEEKIDLLFEQHRADILDYFYQKPENKSRLFKVLNRHLQDDEKFQSVMEEFNTAYKSDTKSSYIRYVDSDEEASDLIAKFLVNKDSNQTYYRRQSLDLMLYNTPKAFTDTFAKKLLTYLNLYMSKCQVATLSQQYQKPETEAAKLIVLSKAYIGFAKDRGIDYKNESFNEVWKKAGVTTL